MFADAAAGITDAARESRGESVGAHRKGAEIVAGEPGEHFVLWHDLEDERHELEKAIQGVRSVYGAQDLDEREAAIIALLRWRHPAVGCEARDARERA
jgi:hypothetical protein